MSKLPKWKCVVQIEVRAKDEDAAMDLISEVWSVGDPEDAHDAVVWVTDVNPMIESDLA